MREVARKNALRVTEELTQPWPGWGRSCRRAAGEKLQKPGAGVWLTWRKVTTRELAKRCVRGIRCGFVQLCIQV